MSHLGSAYADVGDARQAIPYHEQHLAIARELRDRRGESAALGRLGRVWAALEDAHKAIDYYEQALAINREIGDRRGEASVSWSLGRALEKQGNLAQAAELMQVNVDFLSEIGHPDAEKHAALLAQLRQQLAGGEAGTVAKKGETSTMSGAGEDGG